MKRTRLVRKTPLRATHWGITRSTKSKKSNSGLGATRPLVLQRERGRCEICGQPIVGDDWEDHHVFYRSHVWVGIRHQLWNRAPLHDPCHRAAHSSPAARSKLEARAVQRLYAYLGPDQVREVMALVPEGATDPAAFVRAYEQYARHR